MTNAANATMRKCNGNFIGKTRRGQTSRMPRLGQTRLGGTVSVTGSTRIELPIGDKYRQYYGRAYNREELHEFQNELDKEQIVIEDELLMELNQKITDDRMLINKLNGDILLINEEMKRNEGYLQQYVSFFNVTRPKCKTFFKTNIPDFALEAVLNDFVKTNNFKDLFASLQAILACWPKGDRNWIGNSTPHICDEIEKVFVAGFDKSLIIQRLVNAYKETTHVATVNDLHPIMFNEKLKNEKLTDELRQKNKTTPSSPIQKFKNFMLPKPAVGN
jgi:hypothetical protein